MNFNKIGNLIAIISAAFLIILASFGMFICVILANLDVNEVETVINSTQPFFILYLVLGVIGLIIGTANFLIERQHTLAIVHISFYGLILILTIIISFLNLPLIIKSGFNIPIYTFATTFSLFLIASILGEVAGILKITE